MTSDITLNDSTRVDLSKLIDTRLLIQANSGGGKSWLLRRILEQSHGKVQQIVIDLEGEFSTLREKYDYVLAGKDGDTPADPRSAALLARRLLELNVSAIIDLYELSHSDRKKFVRLFLSSMVNAPKALWHPCLVIIDEAHVFAPQTGSSEAMESVIDLAARGRKRGYSAILATQRISKLHKDAVAEMNNKLIGRTGLDIDRKRAAEELGFTTKEDSLSLRSMAPGEFFAFGPAISDTVTKLAIGTVATSHPKAGDRILTRTTPPTDRIKAVLGKLADLPKEAQQESQTVEGLRADNTSLRRKVTMLEKKQPAVAIKEKVITVEKPCEHTKTLQSIVSLASKALGAESAPASSKSTVERPTAVSTAMSPGEQKILIAAGQYKNGVTRSQITILTSYKRSTRNTYVNRLQQREFVETVGDNVIATELGIAELGSNYDPLPTGKALQERLLAELPVGEKSILSILIGAYPGSVDRESISDQTGYARSSRNTYLVRMKAREIITVSGDQIKASDNLFSPQEDKYAA